MPVIFTTPGEHEEHDDRMRALWDEANALHRSLPDGAFRVVATAITLGDRAASMFRNAGRNQQVYRSAMPISEPFGSTGVGYA
jgi:hypothetical protein